MNADYQAPSPQGLGPGSSLSGDGERRGEGGTCFVLSFYYGSQVENKANLRSLDAEKH